MPMTVAALTLLGAARLGAMTADECTFAEASGLP
jgi:hypothetical protein